jgi:hypothetical protein
LEFEEGSMLRVIGERAFVSSIIEELRIPKSVRILEPFCFDMCHSLRTLEFETDSVLEEIGREAFAGASIQKLRIPKSVRALKSGCFHGCPLQDVVLEEGAALVEIGRHAFDRSWPCLESIIDSQAAVPTQDKELPTQDKELPDVFDPSSWGDYQFW